MKGLLTTAQEYCVTIAVITWVIKGDMIAHELDEA
jgi:hypothetical protein